MYNKNCNLKECYKCSNYEECDTRYNVHSAPVLVSIVMGGLIAFAVLGVGTFIQFLVK